MRIRNVYHGSRIRLFSIPDPNFAIPDPGRFPNYRKYDSDSDFYTSRNPASKWHLIPDRHHCWDPDIPRICNTVLIINYHHPPPPHYSPTLWKFVSFPFFLYDGMICILKTLKQTDPTFPDPRHQV